MRRRFPVSLCAALVLIDLAAGIGHAAPATAGAIDKLAKEVERCVNGHDSAGFVNQYDIEGFLDRVMHNLPAPAAMASDIRQGMRQAFSTKLGPSLTSLPEGSTLTYIHPQTVGAEQHAIFRLLGPQGLNYWDCALAVDPAGTPKIVDIHFATTGELQSQTVQRFLLRAMPGIDDGKTNQADIAALADLQKFNAAVAAGQPTEALGIYDRLPEKYRKDKAIQVLRVIATAALNDEAKVDVVADEFKKKFGDDPACDLVLLDTYLTRNKIDEAEACVVRLDKSVGGDAYLDVMRSGFHVKAGNFDKARTAAERAYERDPKLFSAVDMLITVAAHRGDNDETKKWMLVAEREPSFKFRFDEALNDSPTFATFKASKQYKEWLAERPKS